MARDQFTFGRPGMAGAFTTRAVATDMPAVFTRFPLVVSQKMEGSRGTWKNAPPLWRRRTAVEMPTRKEKLFVFMENFLFNCF